jgi:uncharacterized protein
LSRNRTLPEAVGWEQEKAMPTAGLREIEDFLGQRRIALVGVSRQPNDYSRMVLKELRDRGYDVVPVNPSTASIGDLTCAGEVGRIDPAPDSAILLVPDSAVGMAARQCLNAGIKRLWFRRGPRSSPACAEAIEASRAAGAMVVAGECPIMFLQDTAWFHRLHGTLRRWTGTYPA